jgi:cell division transport system ATP-binding protein
MRRQIALQTVNKCCRRWITTTGTPFPKGISKESNMSEPIIEIKNASVFQRENLVLSNVNLTLHRGEFIYLIGRTGSGKSSLLKTLYGELPARDGIVRVAGYDLTQLRRKDIPYLRRKIGIVFQDFQLLFDRSVEKNLEFVLGATGWTEKVEISRRIDEVLAKVGLSDKRKSMPHQMSGGEQQGVAIARALLNEPDVILADEPTGNLDPDTTLEVMKLLRNISENGTAVLMATHNYTLMQKYPSRIANCKNGTVVCSEME